MNAKSLALVVAEIELGQIPLQVDRANMMICPDNSTFEDGKETLNRVRMEETTPDIFFNAVVDCGVTGELAGDPRIDSSFVRHDVRAGVDLSIQDGTERLGAHAGDMMGLHATVTLN